LIFREVEDRDLILTARRGDVDAYNILVSRWEKRIYSYFLKSVGDREDAQDLAQETFLKVYRGLSRLEDLERFPQWLFRIAHNEAISMHRRNRLPMAETEDLEQAAARSSPMRGPGPRAETAVVVAQALGNLPADQRDAVVLKVYHGFKFHEIAEIVGCPVSTVKSRVYSGFEALKLTLAPSQAAVSTATGGPDATNTP
jgi:RNA polymerase sigma-70 factor (ECF subfamily)